MYKRRSEPRFHSYFSLLGRSPLPDAPSRFPRVSRLTADGPDSLKGRKRYSFRSQRYLIPGYCITDTILLSSIGCRYSIIFLGKYLRYSYAIDKSLPCSL